jgi:lipopolysaccharide heptosyltransferase II
MDHIHKTLIIKLRAIGDVVLSTAVLPNLRAAYPDSELHFLVESSGKEILEGNPYTDRIIVLPRKEWEELNRTSRWLKNWQFMKQLRSEHYDLVFDLFGNPRSAILTWITGARHRVGFSFRGRKIAYNHRVIPRGDRIHEVAFNLDALISFGIPVRNKDISFFVKESDQSSLKKWMQKKGLDDSFVVGLHTWGSWSAKRWGLEKFAQLADHLIEYYDARILLLWGPGEKDHARRVQKLGSNRMILAPPTTLKELGALLSLCDLVVANDSGPMHIATAVGTPTVGIFGPTNWKLQGPYGEQNASVYHKNLMCLGCNRLECDHKTCMEELAVSEVSDVIKTIIEKYIKKELTVDSIHASSGYGRVTERGIN